MAQGYKFLRLLPPATAQRLGIATELPVWASQVFSVLETCPRCHARLTPLAYAHGQRTWTAHAQRGCPGIYHEHAGTFPPEVVPAILRVGYAFTRGEVDCDPRRCRGDAGAWYVPWEWLIGCTAPGCERRLRACEVGWGLALRVDRMVPEPLPRLLPRCSEHGGGRSVWQLGLAANGGPVIWRRDGAGVADGD